MKFKLVEKLDSSSESLKKYYHGNNELFEIGHSIKKEYSLRDEIVTIYNHELENKYNVENIVYMSDEIKEEYYIETYKYLYEVYPEKVLKCRMNFSPLICELDFNAFKKATKYEDDKKLITLFAKAYCYKLEANELNELCEKLEWSSSIVEQIEYISNKVIITDIIAKDGELL